MITVAEVLCGAGQLQSPQHGATASLKCSAARPVWRYQIGNQGPSSRVAMPLDS